MDFLQSSAFRKHTVALLDQYHLPGLSITVSQNHDVASAAFGVASRNTGKECSSETLFDIASCSKSLTAASVALLVDDNKKFPEIQWNTPVNELLPEDFVMPTAELTEKVTIEDILSHRTGMALHDLSYLGIRAEHPDTAKSITRKLRSLPTASTKKQKYMLYNNMMFSVASHLVETQSGMSFAEFLRKKFFEPLGMTSTYLQPSSAVAAGQGERLSSGHQFYKTSGTWDEFEDLDAPEGQGAGSIVTSSADYVKWVEAMLYRQHSVSETVYKGLTKPRILNDPGDDPGDDGPDPFCSPSLYCLGLETYTYRGHQVVIHEGLIDGFGASHFFLPGHDFGAAILGNSDGAEQVTWVLARELIDATLDVPISERPNWAALQAEKLKSGVGEPGDENQQLREKLLSDPRPEMPAPALEAYVGKYKHPGYGIFEVQIKDDGLFIDALDRGFSCTFTFDHVRTWRDLTEGSSRVRSAMVAHIHPIRGGPEEHLESQFVFDAHDGDGKDGRAKEMAILLEDSLPDGELIWFVRV